MTVEDRMGDMVKEEAKPNQDGFPIGMRVLAVDDDPICLKLLESLLNRCQYHVTVTNRAAEALEILREHKDEFDLVISDVHMPDMDGYRLLELVGLEMDLPVIMLSGNGETEAVMKGITHGACDYLLKPVRIEELRNIWQHVIRRKKFDARDHNSSDNGDDCETPQVTNTEDGQDPLTGGPSDRNRKHKRSLKVENEDGCEENGNENDDASTQKKQRVVWSIELHHKFVAAVNQLGVDKAVPKKILDIMNVETLTRENVASHLQKYRLYLKRLSVVASQQADMFAAFGGRHPSYLPMGTLDGFRNANSLVGSRQLPALAAFQPNNVLGRMNSSMGFGQHGFVPSGTIQHDRVHNITSNDGLLGNADGNFLQAMPVSHEFDQQHKTIQETNNHFSGVFSRTGLINCSAGNSFSTAMNNPILLPQQCTQPGILNSHSSVKIPSLSSDPFGVTIGNSPPLPDLGRCNDNWQGHVPSNNYPTNGFNNNNNVLDSVNPVISHMDSDLLEASSSRLGMAPLCNSVIRNGAQVQASSLSSNALLMLTGDNERSKFLSSSRKNWDRQNQNQIHNANLVFSSSQSLPNLHMTDANAETSMLNNGQANQNMDMTISGQNCSDLFLSEDCRNDRRLNYNEEGASDSTKLHGDFSSNGCNFHDIERDDVTFFDGDLVSDILNMDTCM